MDVSRPRDRGPPKTVERERYVKSPPRESAAKQTCWTCELRTTRARPTHDTRRRDSRALVQRGSPRVGRGIHALAHEPLERA